MNPTFWAQYLDHLKSRVRADIYHDYLACLNCRMMSEERWELCLPDRATYNWVESQLYSVMLESLQTLMGEKMTLSLSIMDDSNLDIAARTKPGQLPFEEDLPSVRDTSVCESYEAAYVISAERKRMTPNYVKVQQSPSPLMREATKLNPDFSFDNFIKGSSNEFAYAASKAVANNPAGAYNPLFLYGGVGLGKTHLMHAIGNEVRQTTDLRVRYMTSEEFTNKLISAIQSKSMPAFRERIRRNCDLLLLDDVQFIAGKESTQEEFFHTFNEFQSYHKQIVLTSDRPPQDIKNLEERLKSRFAGGLITDIQLPDYETRLAILRQKAESENVILPDEVAQYLSSKVTSNIRELEGSYKRIKACAEAHKERINMALALRIIEPFLKTRTVTISVDRIIKRVCTYYGISVEDLKGRSRTKPIVRPRQIAMYLSRLHTNLSLPDLGRIFDRDHSSVLSGIQRIKLELTRDPAMQYDVKRLEDDLLA